MGGRRVCGSQPGLCVLFSFIKTTMARCCCSEWKAPRHFCHPFNETCSAQFFCSALLNRQVLYLWSVLCVLWLGEPSVRCRHTLPCAPLPSRPAKHALINRGSREKQHDTTGYSHYLHVYCVLWSDCTTTTHVWATTWQMINMFPQDDSMWNDTALNDSEGPVFRPIHWRFQRYFW